MSKKNISLRFSVIISTFLLTLSVSQKSSFANELYDIDLMSQYLQGYDTGVNCSIEHPLYSSCYLLRAAYLNRIHSLLIKVGDKAIKDPVGYCHEVRQLYSNVLQNRNVHYGLSGYTWINNYCDQNHQ